MADLISGNDVANLNHNAFRKVLNGVMTAEAGVQGVGLAAVESRQGALLDNQ
jgi:hypothetical protein